MIKRMNYFSEHPNDRGICVVGGLTGLGDTTQNEFDEKIAAIHQNLREHIRKADLKKSPPNAQ